MSNFTLLKCVQEAMSEIGSLGPSISSLINVQTTSAVAREFLGLSKATARHISSNNRDYYKQNRVIVFDTVANQSVYPLPADFNTGIQDASYNRTSSLKLYGPLNETRYQARLAGQADPSYRQYKLGGILGDEIVITPTPTSVETYAFPYQSLEWVTPPLWATGVYYAQSDYITWRGNRYYSNTAETKLDGGSPPTHTDGSEVSNGSISWVHVPTYIEPLADTDIVIFPSSAFIMGIVYYWYLTNGFPQAEKAEKRFEDEVACTIAPYGRDNGDQDFWYRYREWESQELSS